MFSASGKPVLEFSLIVSCPPSQECSELRERSIHLFTHLVDSLVGRDKRRMKTKARRAVVPLLLHMNEQTQSVAQVKGSKLGSGDPMGVVLVLWARAAGPHLPCLAQQPVPRL